MTSKIIAGANIICHVNGNAGDKRCPSNYNYHPDSRYLVDEMLLLWHFEGLPGMLEEFTFCPRLPENPGGPGFPVGPWGPDSPGVPSRPRSP